MTTLRCTLVATTRVEVPELASTALRGALGRSLRALSCTTGAEECAGCELASECAYGVTWEGSVPGWVRIPAKYRDVPRPYILLTDPDDQRRCLEAGDETRLELKLIGAARRHAVSMMAALQAAARRGVGRGQGRLALDRVVALRPDGRTSEVFDGAGFRGTGPIPFATVTPEPVPITPRQSVWLVLETPAEIRHGSQALQRFDPAAFTARLAERLDIFSLAWERERVRWDASVLTEQARRVRVLHDEPQIRHLSRRSIIQGRFIPMSGMLDAVQIQGATPDLVGLWQCAEVLHAGKKASFGFGRVRVIVADNLY